MFLENLLSSQKTHSKVCKAHVSGPQNVPFIAQTRDEYRYCNKPSKPGVVRIDGFEQRCISYKIENNVEGEVCCYNIGSINPINPVATAAWYLARPGINRSLGKRPLNCIVINLVFLNTLTHRELKRVGEQVQRPKNDCRAKKLKIGCDE